MNQITLPPSTERFIKGTIVTTRKGDDRRRCKGKVVDALPFGEFMVKWDSIERPERVLGYDITEHPYP